ncbi:MAG: SDR family oxidoreductase [Pseudomonadota bacterium]
MSGVLVVTGASRGIGAATARLAATRGYSVCVNYQSNASAAQDVVEAIAGDGGRAIAVQADVAREDQVETLFETCQQDLGPITGLVNNAGATGLINRLEDCPGETLRRVVEVNLLGALYCSRAAVRRMSIKNGGTGGAIVNLSSGAATIGSPNEYVWYAAAKGGINSLTIGLAKEVAGDGIRVNGVAPGFVKTEIHAAAGLSDRLERDAPKVPIGRAAEVEELAEPILWLLSDAASYVTGAILRVAGGR